MLTDWEVNGVYCAANDPFDPHAIYLGGEGRLGYLRPDPDGGVSTELRWTAGDAGPYTYVTAVFPSSTVANSVVFGGASPGGGPARVVEIQNAAGTPKDVPLEGSPMGVVRGIVRADTKLLIFLETGSTLDIYAIGR